MSINRFSRAFSVYRMELKHCLQTDRWEMVEPSKVQGFKSYSVIRQEVLGNGEFNYAVRLLTSNEADHCNTMSVVKVTGSISSTSGPLNKVNNCELVLDGSDVIAINMDGDCAIIKKA